jgi:hypothetical protein
MVALITSFLSSPAVIIKPDDTDGAMVGVGGFSLLRNELLADVPNSPTRLSLSHINHSPVGPKSAIFAYPDV